MFALALCYGIDHLVLSRMTFVERFLIICEGWIGKEWIKMNRVGSVSNILTIERQRDKLGDHNYLARK